MAIISVASEASNASAQNKMADAQAKSASNALATDYNQLLTQQYQIQDQGKLDILERTRQGLRERAMLGASLSGSGIAGATADRLFSDSQFQQSYDTGIMEQNMDNAVGQSQMEMLGAGSRAESRFNEARSGAVGKAMGLMRIGSAAFSGAMAGQSYSNAARGSSSLGTSIGQGSNLYKSSFNIPKRGVR